MVNIAMNLGVKAERNILPVPEIKARNFSSNSTKIAEGSRDRSILFIFSCLHTLHFPKFDQCQVLSLQLHVLLMTAGVTTRNM
jgi:hypothetical protein